MYDYSSYKVSSANGNFTAAIWNGFFAAVNSDFTQLAQDFSVVEDVTDPQGANIQAVSTRTYEATSGNIFPAAKWNHAINDLHSLLTDLYSVTKEDDSNITSAIAAIDALHAKAKDDSISNTVWNSIVQNTEDAMNYIKTDFDEKIAEANAWKFGNAMPIVLC